MEHSVKVYEALIEAGQEFGIGDFGIYAMNVMRLEHGFRMWGAEVSIRYKSVFTFTLKCNWSVFLLFTVYVQYTVSLLCTTV